MTEAHNPRTKWGVLGIVVGLVLALLIGSAPALGLPWVIDATKPNLNYMAGVVVLMAIWWMTEAVPLPVTALLPIALFPLLSLMPAEQVVSRYGDRNIFLFLGGFLIALAFEESGLHRRLALRIVSVVGENPRQLVGGFMLATAVLSMWLSNTATALMILPIALSVLAQLDHDTADPVRRKRLGAAMMLGVGYAASMGGVGTLVGTPTNVYYRGFMEREFPDLKVGFFDWMYTAVPLAFILLFLTWLLLVWVLFPLGKEPLKGSKETIGKQLEELGPMTAYEWRTLAVFLCTALLWTFRAPADNWGWAPLLGLDKILINGKEVALVDDSTIAIAMAILCFLIPTGRKAGETLLDWSATQRLPWGILLLFGGGLALAEGMKVSQLDLLVGGRLGQALSGVSPLLMAIMVCTGVTFLSELASNQACIQMLAPLLAKAALAINIDPRLLLVPATISASWGFMLPVATPPNAIVYATGRISIVEMVRAGFFVNLLAIAVTVAVTWLLGG